MMEWGAFACRVHFPQPSSVWRKEAEQTPSDIARLATMQTSVVHSILLGSCADSLASGKAESFCL